MGQVPPTSAFVAWCGLLVWIFINVRITGMIDRNTAGHLAMGWHRWRPGAPPDGVARLSVTLPLTRSLFKRAVSDPVAMRLRALYRKVKVWQPCRATEYAPQLSTQMTSQELWFTWISECLQISCSLMGFTRLATSLPTIVASGTVSDRRLPASTIQLISTMPI